MTTTEAEEAVVASAAAVTASTTTTTMAMTTLTGERTKKTLRRRYRGACRSDRGWVERKKTVLGIHPPEERKCEWWAQTDRQDQEEKE